MLSFAIAGGPAAAQQLAGALSPTFLHRIQDQLEACLPDARQTVIPATSHALWGGNPTACNETALAFLAQHGGGHSQPTPRPITPFICPRRVRQQVQRHRLLRPNKAFIQLLSDPFPLTITEASSCNRSTTPIA